MNRKMKLSEVRKELRMLDSEVVHKTVLLRCGHAVYDEREALLKRIDELESAYPKARQHPR